MKVMEESGWLAQVIPYKAGRLAYWKSQGADEVLAEQLACHNVERKYAQAYKNFVEKGIKAYTAEKPVDEVERLVSRLRPEQREAYDRLMAKAKSKTASRGKINDWAFEHRNVPWEEIDASEAPSRGAIGMLLQIKYNNALYNDLLKKRAPTTAQMNREQEDLGDGGDAESLIERCLAEAKG